MDRIEYGVDVCRAVFRKMFPSTLDAKRKLSLMSYRNFQENKEEIYPARKCKTKNKTEFPQFVDAPKLMGCISNGMSILI